MEPANTTQGPLTIGQPWAFDVATVTLELKVDVDAGLSSIEASDRLARLGPNELVTETGPSAWALLLRQFANAMVLILIAAAIVTALTGEVADTIVISVIVVLNGIVGFVQEFRAQRALEALKGLEAAVVTVRRDGHSQSVPAPEVVIGDVVELAAGDLVSADLRLIETRSLRVAEAALTGESEPSLKDADTLLHADAPSIADRHNMAFKGTAVTFGRGAGVVVATGMQTQLGQIADLLEVRSEVPTPLQLRLTNLARWMAIGAAVICALVFVLGVARGEPTREMFLTAVSLAVAAIPEGLPAVITVALALGARRMADRHALIRKLVAVETLGSVNVICTDKTGTLTENRMLAERVWTPIGEYRCSGRGYAPDGDVVGDTDPASDPYLGRLALVAALCNDAHLRPPDAPGGLWELLGDPTEGALLALAGKLGIEADQARRERPRLEELPFDSDRRRMTTLHQGSTGFTTASKGALEAILPLTAESEASHEARSVAEGWASEGLRVLAVADRSTSELPRNLEQDLSLLGLVGIADPPRPEAAAAVAACGAAGMKPVVITGDHPSTVAAIAGRIGVGGSNVVVVTGDQLAAMDDRVLEDQVEHIDIYARVSPSDKLRIVRAWQNRRAVVAMTGDGVNDAPALRRADIGIAMGMTGTDVSKESADMVLTDDNFATIVQAVEEGRRIYDNIRRVVRYLLSTNSGELWAMLLAPLIGLPIPLIAVQILWMNLVTDGLPAIALGLEPVEPDAMGRTPRPRDESLFADGLWQHVLWVGLLMAATVLSMEAIARAQHWPWQTMVFTTLALLQLGHSLAVRSERRSTFKMPLRSNPWLFIGVVVTLIAQLIVVYFPPLQSVFDTAALNAVELAYVIVASTVVFFAVELEKLVFRRRSLA